MKKRGIYYAFRPLFSLKRRAAEEQFCKKLKPKFNIFNFTCMALAFLIALHRANNQAANNT